MVPDVRRRGPIVRNGLDQDGAALGSVLARAYVPMSDDRLKYATDFAQAALRGLLTINGGAIIALFTFIGHNGAVFSREAIWWAFTAFSLGLVSAVAAQMCGYLSHVYSRIERFLPAGRWEYLGVGCALGSLGLFLLGSLAAIMGVLV